MALDSICASQRTVAPADALAVDERQGDQYGLAGDHETVVVTHQSDGIASVSGTLGRVLRTNVCGDRGCVRALGAPTSSRAAPNMLVDGQSHRQRPDTDQGPAHQRASRLPGCDPGELAGYPRASRPSAYHWRGRLQQLPGRGGYVPRWRGDLRRTAFQRAGPHYRPTSLGPDHWQCSTAGHDVPGLVADGLPVFQIHGPGGRSR